MQVVAHDNHTRFEIATGDKLAAEPFAGFVSALAGLHRFQVLDVVADDEFGSVLAMNETTDTLPCRHSRDAGAVIGENERHVTPFVLFLTERPQVAAQEPIRLQLGTDVTEHLPRLFLRLADEEDIFFLLAAHHRPEKEHERHDGRLARSTERDDDRKMLAAIFQCIQKDVMEVRERILHVVAEIEQEVPVQVFLAHGGAHLPVFHQAI